MPLIEDLGNDKVTGPARFYSYSRVAPFSGDSGSAVHVNNNSNNVGARGKRLAAAHSRISDSSSRQRAINKRLLDLDRENYNDTGLSSSSLSSSAAGRDLDPGRRGSTPATRRILASRKTLTNLLDDDPAAARDTVLVLTAPPKYPVRIQLCSVCGFEGKYVCPRCGYRYCSLGCDETHKETRCIKMYV